jgi:hypothetical protein
MLSKSSDCCDKYRKLRHYEETNEIDNNVLKTRIYISG